MTVYGYRCSCHGNFELDFPMGTAPLQTNCFAGSKALRVYGAPRISMYATPNRTGAARVRDVDQTEAKWAVDLPAYKRMRDRGLQPPSTEGTAALEQKVDSQFDINYRKALDAAARTGGGGRDRVLNAVGDIGGVM